MKIEEMQEKVIENKLEVTGFQCDCCETIHEGKDMPNSWITFSRLYPSSSDELHLCSPKCFFDMLESIKDDVTAENTVSPYITSNFFVNLTTYITELRGVPEDLTIEVKTKGKTKKFVEKEV